MDYEKIWLQIETDPESEWCDEVIVTWCQDQIGDDDVEYVHATKYAELEAENEQLKIIINDILAERVKELEAENERLRDALEGIRDLARTGTAPMAYNMTPEEWNKHKLNEIAAEAQAAINAGVRYVK